MKDIFVLFVCLCFGSIVHAQNNSFPTTGNVGIGTTTPQYKLQVNGGVSVHGVNTVMGINGYRNFLQFVDGNHAAILYNPGQPSQLMFGFNSNGSMHWGGTAYSMILTKTGDLRIINTLAVGSSLKTGSKMSVSGKLSAHEVQVTTSNWPDYVFHQNYSLMPLDSLEQFITAYGHLPEMPTAQEVETNGVQLGEMVNKLLKKNEELTLHLIEKNKQIEALEKRVTILEADK